MKLHEDTFFDYEEKCYQLLMERLQAITFVYDVKEDVMIFRAIWNHVKETRIEDYRKKICTEQKGYVHPEFKERILALLMGQNVGTQEFLLDPSETPHGNYAWYEIATQPCLDENGRMFKNVGVLWNIEERKGKLENGLRDFRSEKDAITGLLNGKGLEAKMAQYFMCHCISQKNALIVVEAANFQFMQKKAGTLWSDRFLMEVAGIVKHAFRSTDEVAHLGRGLFAVFMKAIDDVAVVPAKAKRLQLALESGSQDMEGIDWRLGMSIYPLEGRTYTELLSAVEEKLKEVSVSK